MEFPVFSLLTGNFRLQRRVRSAPSHRRVTFSSYSCDCRDGLGTGCRTEIDASGREVVRLDISGLFSDQRGFGSPAHRASSHHPTRLFGLPWRRAGPDTPTAISAGLPTPRMLAALNACMIVGLLSGGRPCTHAVTPVPSVAAAAAPSGRAGTELRQPA